MKAKRKESGGSDKRVTIASTRHPAVVIVATQTKKEESNREKNGGRKITVIKGHESMEDVSRNLLQSFFDVFPSLQALRIPNRNSHSSVVIGNKSDDSKGKK